ncbi:MAG: asparagine synthase (glutamine-hydrolyzing) [Phycisphaerae bacterium]|nr:asparagine synthase (glutamine-hydrolyzing) [Phycisphaerae bacterium]
MPAMCGFAGEFLLGAGRADLQLARRMAQCLFHRGPDEQGAFLSADGRCAIGFRRLAIIDPPGSHQPMTSDDGLLTVAFNGEIYNFRQLRQELTAGGCRFRTAGDTEVLLHLFRRDGLEMLRHLDGMFAFALYDARSGQVLLARDRLGEKPLWYAPLPDRIVFASEAKAILLHPQVSRETDPASLTYYLTVGYMPAPISAYRAIAKLAPGSSMVVSDRIGRAERYWQPSPIDLPADRADLPELLRTRVSAAVASRMISDVPLGALLSGGVDSSIVVAAMSRAAGAVGGVRTFTAGFADSRFDERPAARAVAHHCGTDHTELLVQASPAGALDAVVSLYDEPFADSGALPTWLISREARRHVTVALTGDGGDEVFGGYDRYRALQLGCGLCPLGYALVRAAAALVRPFARGHERSRLRRLARFAEALPYPPSVQYFRYRSLFGPDDLPRLLSDQALGKADIDRPAEWFCDLYEGAGVDDEVLAAQRHDLSTYLPDDLLVKTDIASMACSLELRAPMLQAELVSLGLSLPTSAKIAGGRGKAILREAFADWLPAHILRAPKRGFGVPLARWLREDLRKELDEWLLRPAGAFGRMFRPEALAGLVNDHLSGRADHSHRLWALLVLARWMAGQVCPCSTWNTPPKTSVAGDRATRGGIALALPPADAILSFQIACSTWNTHGCCDTSRERTPLMASERKHATRPRLGRGLSSLISGTTTDLPADDKTYQHVTGLPPIGRAPAPIPQPPGVTPQEIPVDDIAPNPYQPRRQFNEAELSDLTASVAAQGILQPIIVAAVSPTHPQADAHIPEGKPFVLVTGERRLRAARQAGLATVPCILRKASPQQMLEWALVENIQRADLNAIERAQAYRQYIDRFQLTQAQAGERLGQPRATVANYLRLMELHEAVQKMIADGTLSFGHAKLLASLGDDRDRQLQLARRVARTGMSVRQLEAVLELALGRLPTRPRRVRAGKPPYLLDLQERLTRAIGTRVVIQPARAKNTGKVVIDYFSLEDFDRISAALGLEAEG